ncbi:META domain-containing protein [Inhella crocodyli]|uniref:META domain-containing protein n=1 Tax=Inhella crocodyli TaxID=2499851 RepID=A0A3S2UEU1_9BURK|nr:META domain-containing protein [Inhella crocodyli]RVT83854.1 META domain-containing protein [Inhella crocodyli]
MKLWIGALGALALSSTAALADASMFDGTRWHLLSIQSMDDAQGTTRIDDPNRFTLHFQPDGQAVFRLDCNRGQAQYESSPAADKNSGQMRFGPVAATRALCAPPHLDERVARDLGAVRSYLLKDGRLYLTLMADGGIYEWAPTLLAGTAMDLSRRHRSIEFAKGRSEATVRDRIQGYEYVDHTLRAQAGQRLRVSLQAGASSATFNLLPPGSISAAMAIGERSGNRYDGLLPDDGLYTVRVVQPRAAGRRGEISRYTLKVAVSGAPLKPRPATADAVMPGTRFHASTTVACEPPFTQTRQCEALVVRRGFDGSATVLLRWDDGSQRRILFVRGEAVASDALSPLKSVREAEGWRIEFDQGERYNVPEALVRGG